MDQLVHLTQLNLSYNNLTHLPTSIYSLTKLTQLDISFNPFTHISANLARLINLSLLDLSNTEIKCIPAELLNLSMTTIKLDNCPLSQEEGLNQNLSHDPMSLVEQCARQLIQPILYDLITAAKKKKKSKHKSHKELQNLPSHILHYLSRPKACSSCGGPYFKRFVTRYRIVQRQDETWIPVEYRLCCAHWNNEKDRILSLFSDLYSYSLPTTSEPCHLKLV
jgi:Leucine-rich repeat (LRR) protein